MTQSVSQSASQSASQSVSQTVNELVSQSVSQSVNESVRQSVNESDSQWVSQSVCQTVDESVSLSVMQLMNRSVEDPSFLFPFFIFRFRVACPIHTPDIPSSIRSFIRLFPLRFTQFFVLIVWVRLPTNFLTLFNCVSGNQRGKRQTCNVYHQGC